MNYPWDKIPDLYFAQHSEFFELFAEEVLKRDGIRAVGGPGYGIFETVQDLVGYQDAARGRGDTKSFVFCLYL